jgi:peptide/nickel transport system substrate-binding protein
VVSKGALRRAPLAALLATGLAGAWLAACRAPTPRTLCLAHEGEIVSMDPLAASDTITHSVLSNLYDSLVDYDSEMRLVPRLAISWSTPADDLWLLELRTGVRTHDGGTLTAEDVRASLLRARDGPDSDIGVRVWSVQDIQVVDASHIQIHTRVPDPLLLNRLASVLIVPQRAKGEPPVGTGGYRFVRKDASGLEVAAFAEHWAGVPAIPRLRFVAVEPGEQTSRVLAGGRVDVLRWVPEGRADEVGHLPRVRLVEQRGLRALFLWLNSAAPRGAPPNPFADRRVRQAVSLAVDRRAVAQRVGRWSKPLHQFIPPGVFGHDPELPELPFDPARARQLLAEAGYEKGFETALTHVPGATLEAQAVQASLAEVGIRVSLDERDWPSLHSAWREGRLPFFLASWRFETGEGSLFLQECIFSRYPQNPRSWNPGFSDRRVDELIRENFRLFGGESRRAHFVQIQSLLREEMPDIPLLSRHDLYAVAADVRWHPRMDGRLLGREMGLED